MLLIAVKCCAWARPMPSCGVCLSICSSHLYIGDKTNIFRMFSLSGTHRILTLNVMSQFRLGPPNRGVKCKWGRQKSWFLANIWLHRVLSPFDRQVLHTQLCQTVAGWWHSSQVSGVVCCSREMLTKFVTRSFNVMWTVSKVKTTDQHLIVCSGKSEA